MTETKLYVVQDISEKKKRLTRYKDSPCYLRICRNSIGRVTHCIMTSYVCEATIFKKGEVYKKDLPGPSTDYVFVEVNVELKTENK